jgi:hypothetical protein
MVLNLSDAEHCRGGLETNQPTGWAAVATAPGLPLMYPIGYSAANLIKARALIRGPAL